MSTGLSTLYPVLSIFFVFAIALLLLPVPGFVHTRNASVLFYVAWLVLGNFAYGLNTFLWRGNTTNRSPVYCDIVTFLIAMLPIGIACSLLCINRLVWNISRSSTLFLVNNPRRNRVDTLICIVVPFMFGALRLLVQDKRFTIVEDVGCIPSVDHTLPALFIYYLPPSLICCCITSIYCTLSIINFCKNRYMSSSLLPNDARHAMTPNQFLRLTLLCITSFVFSALFLLSMLVKNVQIGLSSWTTWSSATWNFNRIEVLNRLDLDTLPHQKQLLGFQLLLLPVLAVHFFLFFGFGNEAVRQYRATLGWLGRFPRRLVRHERKQSDLTPVTDELDQLPRGTVVTGFRMTMIKKRGPAWMQSVPPPVRISPPSQGPQDIVLIGNTPPRTPTPPLSLPSRPEPTSPPPLMSPRRTSALAQTQSQIRLSLNNSNLRRLSSLMYRRTPTASRRNSAERHLQPPISPVYIIPSPIQAEAASPNRSSTSSISVSVGHFPFPPSPHFPDTHLPIPTSLRFVSHRASSASVVKSPLDEAVAPKPQRATMADVEKGLHSRSFSQNVPAFFAQYQSPLPQRRSPYEQPKATLSSRSLLRIDADAANALPSGHSAVGFIAAKSGIPPPAVAIEQGELDPEEAESCFGELGSPQDSARRESGYFSLGRRASGTCPIPELPAAIPMEPPRTMGRMSTSARTFGSGFRRSSLGGGDYGSANTASTRSRFSGYSDNTLGSPIQERTPIRSAGYTTRMFSWAAKRVGNGSHSI